MVSGDSAGIKDEIVSEVSCDGSTCVGVDRLVQAPAWRQDDLAMA
jgi:hypothetical protein